ncbi:cobalt-zinc-cadmium resistance protein [Aromatoleum toluvorans]|uniref:Cobalt-zinc-cadmium resistance protein n=1 Tax=Aromatoleum toluvorans TaxID=92002 RepID=A0ABX1Q471_9RHOO|nr:TolC family protein [Aromatoleum toluvorans]NMG45705.1 cobalt-zinc-cadmium resistance protein [Aromatoleum toluvorans]
MTRPPLKGGVALCLALCLPAVAGAQAPANPAAPIAQAASATLSLREAIERALAHNPELAAASLEVEAREGLRQQAGAYPNPELSWLQEDTRHDTRTTTVQLNQPIELGGKRAARMAAADRARDIAAAEHTARRLAIGAAVTSGFFDALIAQERVRVADGALELARRGTRATELRVLAGKVAPVEETRARVAEAGVRVEAAQARSELAAARARLAALLGEPQLAARTLEARLDDLPAAPSPDELQARVDDAPAVRRARLEIDHRVALTEVEKARRIPDLTVSLGAKRSEELGLNQAVIGVAVPLPLFDRNQGNLVDALKREDKAREELSAARLQVSAEALQARERLVAARGETETLATEVLPGAQSAWEAASKGFELGKFSFLEALDAQRTLLQARAQHLRAMAETYRARAELDRILGLERPSGALVAPAPR